MIKISYKASLSLYPPTPHSQLKNKLPHFKSKLFDSLRTPRKSLFPILTNPLTLAKIFKIHETHPLARGLTLWSYEKNSIEKQVLSLGFWKATH